MNASLITRRVRKVVVAGSVLAATLAIAPANAAQVPPPVVQSTSLTAGNAWSKISNAIAVDYNRVIDPALSSVVVTDGVGNVLTGIVDTAYTRFLNTEPEPDVCQRLDTDPSVLMFFLPGAPSGPCPILPTLPALTEEDGPYTATFTAHAVNQITGSSDTVTTYTFRLDRGTPAAPSLTGIGSTALPRGAYPSCGIGTPPVCPLVWPSNPIPKEISVISGGDAPTLTGLAKDRLDGQGNTDLASGIASVTLHFFSATSGDLQGREVLPMRITIANACAGGLCPVDQNFSAQPELPSGYWNVRASTTDLAGNVSGQSDPVALAVLNN